MQWLSWLWRWLMPPTFEDPEATAAAGARAEAEPEDGDFGDDSDAEPS